MGTIRLAIEGPGAVEATEELVSTPDLAADWELVGGQHRDLTLATVVTILGMVGTGVGVASQAITMAQKIYDWYKEWSEGKEEVMIEKVVLVMPDGRRLLLENATLEELTDVIKQPQ